MAHQTEDGESAPIVGDEVTRNGKAVEQHLSGHPLQKPKIGTENESRNRDESEHCLLTSIGGFRPLGDGVSNTFVPAGNRFSLVVIQPASYTLPPLGDGLIRVGLGLSTLARINPV